MARAIRLFFCAGLLRADFFIDASEVSRRIGRGARALGLPDRFAQALEHCVLGVVLRIRSRAQLLVFRAQPGRLVDRELLLDGQMQ